MKTQQLFFSTLQLVGHDIDVQIYLQNTYPNEINTLNEWCVKKEKGEDQSTMKFKKANIGERSTYCCEMFNFVVCNISCKVEHFVYDTTVECHLNGPLD